MQKKGVNWKEMKELNIKEKKIIAREFLLLIICIPITIFIFLTIYPYNYITQNQCIKYRSEIAKKTTKIKAIENKQEDDLLNIVQKMIDNGQTEENIAIVIRKYTTIKVKTDSLISKNFIPPIDGTIVERNTPDSLDEYGIPIKKYAANYTKDPKPKFDPNQPSKVIEEKKTREKNYVVDSKTLDSNQKSKLNTLKEEVQILEHLQKEKNNSYIKSESQLKIAGVAFLISFMVLFVLRYVYYGVKWSIKTLSKVN